jgi:hypothetical protein
LCGKVFGFVKRKMSERSEGRIPLAEKGAAALVPASALKQPDAFGHALWPTLAI